jgi:hypothetical protein
MNWEAIGAIGEVVGAIAVIATLAYLAAQVRQATNSVQGAAELEASKQFTDWHARITNSLELRTIWDKGAADEDLDDVERVQYVWLIAELFFMVEGFFRQYKRGLISKATWEPLEMAVVSSLKTVQGGAWWDSGVAPLSGEFRDHLNEARKLGTDFVLPDVGNRVKPNRVDQRADTT